MTIFLMILIGGVSYYTFTRPELKSKMLFNAYKVYHNKEYYRLLSSGFIHADWFHLGFNLYAFHMFSTRLLISLENAQLPNPELYLVALLILGIIISEIPSLLKHKDNELYNSLGASGGVSSVVFASILMEPFGQGIGIFPIPIYLPPFLFGILYLIYSHHQAKKGTDNIGHDAHIFGGLFGLAFIMVIYPESLGNFIEQLMNWNGDIFQ